MSSTETWQTVAEAIPTDFYITLHRQLHATIARLFRGHSSEECIHRYLSLRVTQPESCKKDLLPFLVYAAFDPQDSRRAIPLAVTWTLYLAAANIMDHAQDTGSLPAANDSLAILTIANKALADLQTDIDTLRDILTALSNATTIGSKAQKAELVDSRSWSRERYFRYIGGKSATLIATGTWLGGRLFTAQEETLNLLKSFGLALGMVLQIGDDCQDIIEDLTNGVFTLPVIEALAMTAHPCYPHLCDLAFQPALSMQDVQTFVSFLTQMGVFATCQRLIRAYQVQAAAAFPVIPNLAPHFAGYVMAKTE